MISASTDSIKEAGNYLNVIATITICYFNITIYCFYITNTIKGGGASLNLNYTTVRCESSYYGKA